MAYRGALIAIVVTRVISAVLAVRRVLLAAAPAEVRGALDMARQAVMWSRVEFTVHSALVNGVAGVVASRNGVVFTIASVIVRNGKIAETGFLADPERLARFDLKILDDRN